MPRRALDQPVLSSASDAQTDNNVPYMGGPGPWCSFCQGPGTVAKVYKNREEVNSRPADFLYARVATRGLRRR